MHVHTAGVGGGERDTYCTSKLQAVDSDVPRSCCTYSTVCTVAAGTPECRKKVCPASAFLPVVNHISSQYGRGNWALWHQGQFGTACNGLELASFGNGCTVHVSTTGGKKEYTLHVRERLLEGVIY
jgi:hypothetical protein